MKSVILSTDDLKIKSPNVTSHVTALKKLLKIYFYKKEDNETMKHIQEDIKIISKISYHSKLEIIPILFGIFLLKFNSFPKICEKIWQYLIKEISISRQLNQIIVFNIFSCKYTYKKCVSAKKLFEIITEFHEKSKVFEPESLNRLDNLNYKNEGIYFSLFHVYNNLNEFIKHNLTGLIDLNKYITIEGKIRWNQIYLNIKNNKLLLKNIKNKKWMQYISEFNFINDLVLISEILFKVPEKNRKNILTEFILLINKELLPNNIYDILLKNINNINSKLLKINDNYSYHISTREHTPFQMIFEFYKIDNNNLNDMKENIKNLILQHSNSFPKKYKKFNYKVTQTSRLPLLLSKINNKNNSFSNLKGNDEQINNNKLSINDNGKLVKSQNNLKINYDNIINGNNSKNVIISNTLTDINNLFSFSGILSGSNDNDIDNIKMKTETENRTQNHNFLKNINNIGIFGNSTFEEISKKNFNSSKKNENSLKKFIISRIVKGGDELRQDYFINQIIIYFNELFSNPKNNINIKLIPFNVLPNGRGGFVETILDSISLAKLNEINFDDIKYNDEILNIIYRKDSMTTENLSNLQKYFLIKFGNTVLKYEQALNNFISSLVGYSLLCYFFEIKDRNNGNILLDKNGNIIHIDFGFLLDKTPGGIKFEKTPFKLTQEFIDLMGGMDSEYFNNFKILFINGFKIIRKNYEIIVYLVELFCDLYNDLNSFHNKEEVIENLKNKFFLNCNEETLDEDINELITISIDNWRTKTYDAFQKFCVGIN